MKRACRDIDHDRVNNRKVSKNQVFSCTFWKLINIYIMRNIWDPYSQSIAHTYCEFCNLYIVFSVILPVSSSVCYLLFLVNFPQKDVSAAPFCGAFVILRPISRNISSNLQDKKENFWSRAVWHFLMLYVVYALVCAHYFFVLLCLE